MIGKRAELVLNRAVQMAFDRGQEYFTLEHVVLSLLDEDDVIQVLDQCKIERDVLESELDRFVEKEVPKREVAPERSEGPEEHPVATLAIQRLIQRALFQVQSSSRAEIEPLDLLVALFHMKDAFALHLLQKLGADQVEVLKAVSETTAAQATNSDGDGDESDPESGASEGAGRAPGGQHTAPTRGDQDPLKQYATELTGLVRAGKIDPLIGRAEELDRMIQTLGRRRKNNPLLVGEAGVGKTALAEGLASLIVSGAVPEFLKDAHVYALDLGGLLAGAKFRGDFEQRLKRVLKALEKRREKGERTIVFIDEIHTIVGAGAVTGSAMDAANLLKPFLARGEIQCIGSTTYTEYRSTFEKDHALARRFQKIDVPEPTTDETRLILKGLRPKLEEFHGVKYLDEAIDATVDLTSQYMNDRQLPDKAIDVLDEVGARARIRTPGATITATQVEEVVSKIARVPAKQVSTDQRSKLKHLDRDLKLMLFGQDVAVDAVVSAIRLARSGLRAPEKPVGSFLFCGPTGVGKTELAKQLASQLGVSFLRFDMSEYMEKHTVSRLIGAPPGYVGFEQAGLLTDAVSKNPQSVVLLDEFEKAHSDVWNLLLQVMDHGTLTDNNGRKVDFRNVVLILTSNVGARELDRKPLGISAAGRTSQELRSSALREVERAFSPEFRNRLDAIVTFNALDPVTIAQVVGKQLLELEAQLREKAVELEITADARDWLARKGYDPLLGARPMARLIQDRIKRTLATELLYGKLEQGGQVKISVSSADDLEFTYSASAVPLPKAQVSEPAAR